jgi:hypothetical protein
LAKNGAAAAAMHAEARSNAEKARRLALKEASLIIDEMIKLTAGGFAGMTTWFFAYPFDVVKSVSQ